MNISLFALIFILGSIIGSFLNVCIYRIPRNISIVFPSSFCPVCKKKIPPYYNIPILGYFLLKGRCKFCNNKISKRYLLIETLTAIFAVISFIIWQPQIAFLNFLFIATLIVITFIDIDFQIIPDSINYSGIIISIIISIFLFKRGVLNTFLATIIGGGLFYIIGKSYEIIAKKEGLGGGDVKLMAFFGAYLGLKAIFFITFVASLTGTIYGIYLMISKHKNKDYAIPFGPFLSLSALIYLFFGDKIIFWYLSML